MLFLKSLDDLVVEKSKVFQKFEFQFSDFFQMQNFEYHIFMDSSWKNDLKTTSSQLKNSKLDTNYQIQHFMNMNYEFEICMQSIFCILVTKPMIFSFQNFAMKFPYKIESTDVIEIVL